MKKQDIKVSVVVPVYNVEKYLGQCLDSLTGQTLREIEIICVNDGSTDDSAAILERYERKDARVIVIRKENTGYGDTMNIGFARARGKYIGILESDDFAEPHMLEKLYHAAERDDLDVVRGNYYLHKETGDEGYMELDEFPYGEIISYREYPAIIRLTFGIWSSLYRREFIEQKNIRFHVTPGASYQDTSFAVQVWMHAERVEFIEDKVLYYRMDNLNSSVHDPGKVFCICDEWHYAEGILDQYPEKKKVLKNIQVGHKYDGYLFNYHRLSSCYQYALLLQISKELMEDDERGYLQEEFFAPHVWKQVERIKKDMNAFFKETSKLMKDDRLFSCHVKNYEFFYEKTLEEIGKYKTVVVYGAGKVGQKIAEILQQNGKNISYFAVTSKSENPDKVMNIPVKEIGTLDGFKKEAIVIIAVKGSNQFEIYSLLNKLGYQNILLIDSYWEQGYQRATQNMVTA